LEFLRLLCSSVLKVFPVGCGSAALRHTSIAYDIKSGRV